MQAPAITRREEQQREGTVEYNYRRSGFVMDAMPVEGPVAEFAAMAVTSQFGPTRDIRVALTSRRFLPPPIPTQPGRNVIVFPPDRSMGLRGI
jgi:hypothetical protein